MEVGKVEQSKWGWKHERKSIEEWKEIQGRNSEQRLLRTAQVKDLEQARESLKSSVKCISCRRVELGVDSSAKNCLKP